MNSLAERVRLLLLPVICLNNLVTLLSILKTALKALIALLKRRIALVFFSSLSCRAQHSLLRRSVGYMTI